MSWHACLFEAKSIQSYILRSGRLRHVVGASELVDGLSGSLLDDCLSAAGVRDGEHPVCARRAGGAVYLFFADAGERDAFHALWSLVVRQYAPGLPFTLASGDGDTPITAFTAARRRLDESRNRPAAELPGGTPVTEYAPRTGKPAVTRSARLGLQDAATARFGLDTFGRRGTLTGKLAPGLDADLWPRNLEYDPQSAREDRAFPFLPGNRYVAIVHADGNDMGRVLRALEDDVRDTPDRFLDVFRAFSESVRKATQAAARAATLAVLEPARRDDGPLPARPIVLGGDDLTILVRADLALDFARHFLCGFEAESRAAMAEVRRSAPALPHLPDALTAACGIAFVKASHPFHLAHELAESLTHHAKQRAKRAAADGRVPPALAFHRVTAASHGDYAAILRDELTVADDTLRTTLEVYGTDPAPQDLPALDALLALVDLLGSPDAARGPARQILTLLGQDLDDSRRRYSRWREVMSERNPEQLRRFDERLRAVCKTVTSDLPVAPATTQGKAGTPLGDVATLLAVAYGREHRDVSTSDMTENVA